MRRNYMPAALTGGKGVGEKRLAAQREINNIFKIMVYDAQRNAATRVRWIPYTPET